MASAKGLQSLIPQKRTEVKKSTKKEKAGKNRENIYLIDVEDIQPNPNQPRREFDQDALHELAASISEHGILLPIVARKIQKSTEKGSQVQFEIIAGERRWRAAKIAKLPRVPVIVRETRDERHNLVLSLIENVQRENLNAIERAVAFKRLLEEFELIHEEIAARVGKRREFVTNTLRLLGLPSVMQESISRGSISEGHARAILSLNTEKAQRILFSKIQKEKLSVRGAEEVARIFKTRLSRAPIREGGSERGALEDQIKAKLGVRVRILKNGKRGSLSISFSDKEELDRILKILLS